MPKYFSVRVMDPHQHPDTLTTAIAAADVAAARAAALKRLGVVSTPHQIDIAEITEADYRAAESQRQGIAPAAVSIPQ